MLLFQELEKNTRKVIYAYVNNTPYDECHICCSDNKLYPCRTCNYKICFSCINKMNTCPYCRSSVSLNNLMKETIEEKISNDHFINLLCEKIDKMTILNSDDPIINRLFKLEELEEKEELKKQKMTLYQRLKTPRKNLEEFLEYGP